MDATHEAAQFFKTADYVVFGGMLVVSTVIGIYHGCSCKKKVSRETNLPGEFLTGNGQLSTMPVAISTLASFLSSITLLGQPAEVYIYGPQLWIFGLASLLCIPAVNYLFIPLFHKMNSTSAYEYFGIRFHKNVQLLASLLFTIQMVLYLALVLYAPAMALGQVTGLNTEIIVSVMYIVVIFYTTIGGIKAVVWTDCFQVLVLFVSMLCVLIKGTIDLGGMSIVWNRNSDAGRTQFFNWDLDPTNRYTVWSCFIGAGLLHNAVYGANQLQVQRYLAVKTVNQARRIVLINVIGWTAIVFLTVYAGMLIFARYYDCDPIMSNVIKQPDQILPLFVMDTLGDYPGIPGIFVAGIFSAGLSTVSTGLNSLAAIWFAQMEGTTFKSRLSEKQGSLTVKLLALTFGLVSFALVFSVPYMGGLVPMAISLSGFFSGALFALFLLGMFVPWVNAVGATAGMVLGIGIVAWFSVGTTGGFDRSKLPISAYNCTRNFTIPETGAGPQETVFYPYRISFLWYTSISVLVTIIAGVAVSWISNIKFFHKRHFFNYNMNEIHKRRSDIIYQEEQKVHTQQEESNKLLIGQNTIDNNV